MIRWLLITISLQIKYFNKLQSNQIVIKTFFFQSLFQSLMSQYYIPSQRIYDILNYCDEFEYHIIFSVHILTIAQFQSCHSEFAITPTSSRSIFKSIRINSSEHRIFSCAIRELTVFSS